VTYIESETHDLLVHSQVTPRQTASGMADPASRSSTAGLPAYEIVTSAPAPVLDFDAFLKMTKPSPRASRKNE
jgi:hypothetical protein